MGMSDPADPGQRLMLTISRAPAGIDFSGTICFRNLLFGEQNLCNLARLILGFGRGHASATNLPMNFIGDNITWVVRICLNATRPPT